MPEPSSSRTVTQPTHDPSGSRQPGHQPRPSFALCLSLALVLLLLATLPGRSAEVSPALLSFQGKVQISRTDPPTWDPAYTNMILRAGDHVRTGPNSRAVVRLSPTTTYQMGENSVIQVPKGTTRSRGFNLLQGIIYFFHRDKPGEFRIQTPGVYAGIRGTEFVIAVDPDNQTTSILVIDGLVTLTNELGQLDLSSRQAAIIVPGEKPQLAPVLNLMNTLQWALYYPGVLNLDDLSLPPAAQTTLTDSLAAYRQGDLLAALTLLPDNVPDAAPDTALYHAALILAVGQVDQARALIAQATQNVLPDSNTAELADSLQAMIALVKRQPHPRTTSPHLPTSLLVESYREQAALNLPGATRLARQAVTLAPRFAFASARLAELEFSSGRVPQASAALQHSLDLAPRNAQSHALNGFLLAARGQIPQALDAFQQAINLDPHLGNAWLGHGLCLIRQGKTEEGRQDLQVAATVEPQRSLFRSYLGKAFDAIHDDTHALNELELAKQLDPNDPTPWLYSALMLRRLNQINDAIHSADTSRALANNRQLYRGQYQLDQDQAVRSVNLALLHQDAGMEDLALRLAGRAVEQDYANYAAHLFRANSLQAQRDPANIDLRYETATVSEFLMADLLAPPLAGVIAQSLSQLEYSSLFEHPRLGLSSFTEYTGNGDWFQAGSIYGLSHDRSFAISGLHRSRNGQNFNSESQLSEVSFQLKQRLSSQDELYLRAIYGTADGQDVRRVYDPTDTIANLRFDEEQKPTILVGTHRNWAPGSDTVLLFGWHQNEFDLQNPRQQPLLIDTAGAGNAVDARLMNIEQQYHNSFDLFTAEAQHHWQQNPHSVTLGIRYQAGWFDTFNQHANPDFFLPFLFPTQPQSFSTEMERAGGYAYYRLQTTDQLQLIGGFSYDWLRYPDNFRFAPLTPDEATTSQISPSAGLIWTPFDRTTVRFGWSRFLSGVSFDTTAQLEPTQIAGFTRAFRSLIPESVAGANSAAQIQTYNLSLEQSFPSGTYIGLRGELLESRVNRTYGAYAYNVPTFNVSYSSTPEQLDYRERNLVLSLNQLIDRDWAVGLNYRLSDATLHDAFPALYNLPPAGTFNPRQESSALLHQLDLFALFNHPSGFFARADALYTAQLSSGDYAPPDDNFWQFNLFAGYRFPNRRAEISVGLLNLSDQDYRLNPLSTSAELPRQRTFVTRLRLNF